MDKKRLVIAIVFALVTVTIGYFLYRIFFKGSIPQQVPPVQEGTVPGTGGLFPTAGEGGVRQTSTPPNTLPTGQTRGGGGTLSGRQEQPRVQQVVTDFLQNPLPNSSGQVQYYNNQDGRFYRLNAQGKPELLTDQVFFNVQNVNWSPTAKDAIIEYPDGSNIYYNFDSKKQVTLPKHWQEFSFASEGNKIAAKSIGLSPDNRWLVVANPDGSEVELVEPLGQNADKVKVDWSPNRQVLGFSRTGEALGSDREEVLLVGANGENFRSLQVEGRGFNSKWSPTGQKIVYSVYNAAGNFKPELWVVNAEGDKIGTGRNLLGINTWADKCAFSNERFVYCGVPTTLETGVGFAPELADGTPDKLWRIDTQTGAKTEIPLDQENHVIKNIVIGEDGKTLFFTDKQQPGLFEVKI